MAFVEVPEERKVSGLVFKDGNSRRFVSILGTHISHKGNLLDMTPIRRNDAVIDGWEITTAGWHYRIGQPNGKPSDGWVGFGGLEGKRWFYSRLVRVGYLHYPTRAWQDIGGAPSYVRANLSANAQTVDVGGVQIKAISDSEWRNIWATPGSGEVYLKWGIEGKRLKENIVLNEAARNWIVANRPPLTPVASTYFGFVFQLDVSDIPRMSKAGVLQDFDGDFDDDNGTSKLTIEDGVNEVLGFLPISKAYSQDLTTNIDLRKRIWKDLDGNVYLLVGAKVSDFNGMPAGDVVFDPTFQVQPDSSAGEDSRMSSVLPNSNFGTDTVLLASAGSSTSIIRFDLTSIPVGATITSAVLSVWSLVGGGGSAQTVDMYRVLPGRITWNESQVTWNEYKSGSAWFGGGGIGTLDIDTSGPIASVSVPVANGTQCDFVINVAQMQTILSSNAGMIFYQSSGDSSAFSSSDSGTVGVRPMLTLEYSVPASGDSGGNGGRRFRMRSEDELRYHDKTPIRKAVLNVRLASQGFHKDSHAVMAAEFRKKVENR